MKLPSWFVPARQKNQVLLVASGDLRPAANRNCWAVAARDGSRSLRRPSPTQATSWCAAHPYRPERRARLHQLAERRDERLRRHRPQGAADRGRSRLAILAPCAARPGVASRADSHRGQLVGHLAGPGRHAQSERLADQGRRQLFDAVERRFHRRLLSPHGLRRWLRKGAAAASRRSRRRLARSSKPAQGRAPARQDAGRAVAARKSHHGRVRRGMHGHVQRHHPRRSAAPHRRLQGTAQPIGAVLRNDAGQRRRGRGRAPLDGRARHEVRHRHQRRETI